MKEFVLSLLSRGYGQVVQTDGDRQHGRLEVCFEPEDYFNWRSQPPLLRISNSAHLLGAVEPTPPKTYSTRRGPLILYSEELALTSCQTVKVNRKGRALRTSREETEVQLHTLQDLTEAILAYGKKQSKAKMGCKSSLTQRVTHLSHSHRGPRAEHDHVTHLTGEGMEEYTSFQGQADPGCPRGGQVRYQPRFLCAPRPQGPPSGSLPPITPGMTASRWGPHQAPDDPVTFIASGPGRQLTTRDVKSLKTTLELPQVQMSAISEEESSAEEEWAGQSDGHMVSECLAACPKDINAQWKDDATEPGGEGKGRSAYTVLRLGCAHLSGVRRHTEEAFQQSHVKQCDTNTRLGRVNTPPNPRYSLLHLPPIGQDLPAGSNSKSHRVGTVKAGGGSEESREDSVPRLPDIRIPDVNTEAPCPMPSERTILRKVLILLPSVPEPNETHLPHDGSRGPPEYKAVREDVLGSNEEQRADPIRRGQGGTLEHECWCKAGDQDPLICFEPEEDKEHQTTPGLLPPIAGHRGPGKQSSMAAYRQDPVDQTESQSGIIRGSLPLELRECQKGGALGTLIMGPAGEIIRLSLWDPLTKTEDHPVLDDATAEHVLRIMTSEGVLEKPWTILLEEQHPPTALVGDGAEEGLQNPGASVKGTNEEIPTPRKARTPDRTAPAQTDRAPVDYTHPVEAMKTSGTYGNGAIEEQACTPEEGSGKEKHSAEHQPHSNILSSGTNTKAQSRRRTRGPQPEGGGTPGSLQSKSVSASSLQRTALSNRTAAEELSHKAKTKPQMESFKHSVPGLGKTRSRRAGGEEDAEVVQTRKGKTGKRKEEFDQDRRRFREDAHSEDTTPQTDVDAESLHADVTADSTPSGPKRKEKKTEAEDEKPKAEPTKSQSKAKQGRKKVKGQAAFVVGKPRTSQEVKQSTKEVDSPERVKTASDTEVKEAEEDLSDVRALCDGVPEHCVDADLLTVCPEDHVTTDSSRSLNSAHSVGTESSRRSSRAAAESGPCSPAPPTPRCPSPHSSSPRCPSPHRPSPRQPAAVQAHHPTSNPSKSPSSADAKGNDEAMNMRETTALAQRAGQRRLEVERKRKEKEEESRRRQEREEREEAMRQELEEEQRQRAEQARLRKLREEEETQREEEREREQLRRQRTQLEQERRRQEEKRRLLECLQTERREEEQRRAAETKRRLQEEEVRRQEEWKKLQEMDETERLEYLRRQREEEEERRKAAEERRRAEEEAARRSEEEAAALAELFLRQRAALEQQLRFHRGLFAEAAGLEQTQDVSRPWVFSYFALLKLLGLGEEYDGTQKSEC
ncbi:uncharacterized protein KIAA2012 homolog isoform X2 [Brachyhypopomus gauderio]|uniref:uncharacterized protein KIAA2012 homolog isoform X2 n=1 Tax=Brachyhypopomus gauderio TaxID=698409 RepID=UPI0040431393